MSSAMSEFEPTPEQQQIIDYEPGHHARVLAGPGTGKSATLVALIDRLLAGIPAPRIRLLTFTRAATGELAKKVSEHPAAAAERPSTIHSFAISVLLRNPGTGGFPSPFGSRTIGSTRTSFGRRSQGVLALGSESLIVLSGRWRLRGSRLNPSRMRASTLRCAPASSEPGMNIVGSTATPCSQNFHTHFGRHCLTTQISTASITTSLSSTSTRDLNACDLEILRLLAERGCSVIGAGDDDQSIYSFRKAAPVGIRRFPDDYAGADDFTLSISQRCGSSIIDWATFVIEGDPDRPPRRRLRPTDDAPAGEVALLAFDGHVAEARGVALLAKHLIEEEGVPPAEILVLLRTDYNQHFSRLIEQQLDGSESSGPDPEVVERMLSEQEDRWLLAAFRLLVHRTDSLAWATLLHLTDGIAESFITYVYEKARAERTQFGAALLAARAEDFEDAPTAPANRAARVIDALTEWLDGIDMPGADDDPSWGHWIIQTSGGAVPPPSEELQTLLLAIDETAEAEQGLGRYLGQICPLGKDHALAQSSGIRIMTMMGAKGLTVRATIVSALEDQIVPRIEPPLDEERRLLYVALTRAREYVFGTWARRRTGPTARVGGGQAVMRRTLTRFLRDGPVASQDGGAFLDNRW